MFSLALTARLFLVLPSLFFVLLSPCHLGPLFSVLFLHLLYQPVSFAFIFHVRSSFRLFFFPPVTCADLPNPLAPRPRFYFFPPSFVATLFFPPWCTFIICRNCFPPLPRSAPFPSFCGWRLALGPICPQQSSFFRIHIITFPVVPFIPLATPVPESSCHAIFFSCATGPWI